MEFGGYVYQQTVGIPMGTNCASLVADLFLYSYEADLFCTILPTTFSVQRIYSGFKVIETGIFLTET